MAGESQIIKAHRLVNQIADFGGYELDLVEEFCQRLILGHERYGDLILGGREFRREATEEDSDWLVYRVAMILAEREFNAKKG